MKSTLLAPFLADVVVGVTQLRVRRDHARHRVRRFNLARRESHKIDNAMLATAPARRQSGGRVPRASPEFRSRHQLKRVNYSAYGKKIALLFAGQGAQVVGMGRDLADQFPVAANLLREADQILGRKLTDVMLNGPNEELTKTSNCQPALFVHGLACLSILRELAGDFPIEGAAGLSLGEMTAHAAAGTFDFANGLKLVQKRGELMDEACAATTGAMAAMIGADENAVRTLGRG